jgi:hypothetical protein
MSSELREPGLLEEISDFFFRFARNEKDIAPIQFEKKGFVLTVELSSPSQRILINMTLTQKSRMSDAENMNIKDSVN